MPPQNQPAAACFDYKYGFTPQKDTTRRRRTRKRLIAAGSRCEGVYSRTGSPSVTFRGKRNAAACVRRRLFTKKAAASDTKFAEAWEELTKKVPIKNESCKVK